MRVLISCRHVWALQEEVLARLAEYEVKADIPRFHGQQLEEDDLLPILHRYDGILAGDDHLTRRVLESAPELRVISKWGVGIDAIDLRAAKELDIAVSNTPGVFGEELADYAMGFIHMLARRQHQVDAKVRSGEWHQVRGVSLAGKTLGVIGLGSSGRALVRRGLASSMRVIGCDIYEMDNLEGCEVLALDDMLAQADVLSLHLPATDGTRHLINEESINRMKEGVWLVNTSRGALVDERALIAALEDGAVGAAALDVFEVEPVARDNPLLTLENVIVGAHNGSNTHEAVDRTTWIAVDNLIRGLGLAVTR